MNNKISTSIPLQIIFLLASLWIHCVDVLAAKNGLNSDALTSFAKNVASVLSTTLLREYRESPTNQTPINLLKNVQTPQTSSDVDQSFMGIPQTLSSLSSSSRITRYARENDPLSERRRQFQNPYISNPSHHAKYFNQELYRQYQLPTNSDIRVSYEKTKTGEPGNVNNANRNSIGADTKEPSIRYSEQFQNPPGFGYKSEDVRSLPDSNSHLQFVVYPHYQHLSAVAPGGSEQSSDTGRFALNSEESDQATKINSRPFPLNYHSQLHASHYPSFPKQLELYPHDKSNEESGSTIPSTGVQEEGSSSKIVDDQSQGQSTLGGFGYNPAFLYRPFYQGGFLPGFPGYFPGPFNDSLYPAYFEQNGGNGTGLPLPLGPQIFQGYSFGSRIPIPQFIPNAPLGRPIQGQVPKENEGNTNQMLMSEDRQDEGNGTDGRPPHGFPPYDPYFGGYYFPPYKVLPFNGFPYRFGHGFHDYLLPKVKIAPYLNLYPNVYHHPPWAPFHPFGGYPPFYNNAKPTVESDKPAQTEETMNEMIEATATTKNEEVETLSGTKSEAVQPVPRDHYEKRLSPVYVAKKNDKTTDTSK